MQDRYDEAEDKFSMIFENGGCPRAPPYHEKCEGNVPVKYGPDVGQIAGKSEAAHRKYDGSRDGKQPLITQFAGYKIEAASK
jgi:hypothetical protein